MKILVCVSKSPDTTSKIEFTDNNTKFKTEGVQYIVNPYDEWYALVRGLELKEANPGSIVTTITVGGVDSEPIIRKALAIGADGAIRIDSEPTNAYFVANQIANYAKQEAYDLVLLGKETIDYNGAQVGAMVAELLDAQYIPVASKLDIDGNTAIVEREAAGGTEEVVKTNLPLVVGSAKGMAEQRIPNMRGIMAARSKKIEVLNPSEDDKLTEIVNYDTPEAKSACKYVDNVDELVELLHSEAKVI